MATITETRTSTPWGIAFAAMVAMMPSSPAISFYSQSLFAGPMTKEFGWTLTQFTAPISIAFLISALLPPLLGLAIDTKGPRKILLPGLATYGLSAASLGFVGGSLHIYMALTLFVTLVSLSTSPVLFSRLVASWVVNQRGLALAITISGLAIGNMIFPPATAFVIEHFGWRAARFMLGLSVLVIALPTVWLFLPEPPEKAARREGDDPGLTLSEILRTVRFWQLAAAFALAALAINGTLASLTPVVKAKGFGSAEAAMGLSIMAVCQLVGRLLSGRLLDMVETPAIGALWLALGTLGLATVIHSESLPGVITGIALLGLALGSEIELGAYYTTRFFGLRCYGVVYGLLIGIYSGASAAGPMVMSLGYDHFSGFYETSMALGAGLFVATLLLLTLGPYRYSAGAGQSSPNMKLSAN